MGLMGLLPPSPISETLLHGMTTLSQGGLQYDTNTPFPELLELIYNGYKRGQSLIKLNRSINYTKQNKHNEHKNLRPPSPAQMCPLVRP